jgi:hypothetical protein
MAVNTKERKKEKKKKEFFPAILSIASLHSSPDSPNQ